MLDAYKKLQANGAIGPMMKINAAGERLFDPSGEQPGTLVVRPFQEFPKVVKRWKDEAGNSHEIVAQSKSEELKIISERIEEFSGETRSPLERERDELATSLSDQQQINGKLEERLNALMAQVERLTKLEPEKPSQGVTGVAQAPKAPLAVSAEKKAVLNQK